MSRQVIAMDAEDTEIPFSDPDHGWLLIYSKGEFLPEEETGSVQRTVDGGLTWTTVSACSLELGALLVAGSLTPNCNAVGIAFSDALNGWITEDCDPVGRMLYRTQVAGGTWFPKAPPNPAGMPEGHFQQAFSYLDPSVFVTPKAGTLLVAERGHPAMLYHCATHDGGRSWRLLDLPGGVWRGAFDSVSDHLAWATGGNALFMSRDL